MTASVTAIEPYQPVSGVPIREALDRAHGHIDKTQKFISKIVARHAALEGAHQALEGAVERVGGSYKKLGIRALNATASGAVGVTIGVLDGRFGGETGHVSKWGVPLDGIVGLAGHGAGILALALGDNTEIWQGLAHAVGDAGLITMGHRFGREIGSAWAHKAGVASASPAVGVSPAVAANANGARGGTVYNVAPAPQR